MAEFSFNYYTIYERRSVMNNRKLAAFILGTVSAVSASAGIAAFAKANDAAMKNSSLENDFIRLTVEQDKSQMEYLRFCLDTNNGQTSTKDDDQKNLTYKNFYSGYTTLNINGENYVYGTGADTSEPKYDASKGTHTSSQKFGDVEVMQTLTFSEGFTKGYNDMLKISYKVLNADDDDKIGVRILLDPMIEDDDDLKLYVNDIKVDNETEFHAPVPDVWKADITADKNITAYGKNSGTEFKPDSITFANWDSLYNEEWNTPFDGSKNIGDSGVAIKWDSVSASGKEFTSYYGIRNDAVKKDDISGKTKVSSPDTSSKTVAGVSALFLTAVASALGCVFVGRKEKKENE